MFCEDIPHAERMRSALVNEVGRVFPDENPSKFVVRITGDSPEGKARLDDLQSVENRYPVIATTSKLLSTGVDVQTCKLVVLDQSIKSMIEFKQIIGRGTRIREEAGKLWFTIMDFRKATELFADPAFDGPPEVVYVPSPGARAPSRQRLPPGDTPDGGSIIDGPIVVHDPEGGEPTGGRTRYIVSGVPVSVLAERVQFYDKDGRLVTESLRDFTKQAVWKRYASLDAFLKRWSGAERKQAIIDELREQGVLLEALREAVGKELDPFDMICHVVFDQPPLTRKERAENVKKRNVFTRYGPQAKAVLEALLARYADEGVVPDQDLGVLRVKPLSDLGTAVEIVRWFGGREGYVAAVKDLETALHTPAA